ncbi:hypothetical protein IMZ31_21925 (plasmid) [Pontibacillus sp. ALD_SL1]|uniref:DUF488 family protein, N3 subclade n=1 Tax=Pontibacillus sp. ALD_SL1 TaxID=2777185 RepID=UPI001A96AE84|nr:hypothetical protein [Pontibacillus sp. ALD_SL1]QST02112.1 hypothetical protein IMZ31_21925 [Pontibacillus sp. ALD_SL1]
MVKVYTSQFSYRGPNRLDTTVKSGDKTFAPSWEMVMGIKNGTLSEEGYTDQYVERMRNSYRQNKSRWEEVLNMGEVVLVCYCNKDKFCHRKLLARLLAKGFDEAEYVGEVDRDGQLIH